MALLDRAQLSWLQYARIGAINFSASGADDVVTTAITTVLSTAGDGGVAVPLQVASATLIGVVTATTDNVCLIVNTATKRPVADATGNEVYGKLTEAAGVYTLTYFSLIAGTETPYTGFSATGIDFYFIYQFDAYRFPRNSGTALSGKVIQQDPSGSAGSTNRIEKVTVTALNTLAALSFAPTATTNIILHVNGKSENAFGGGNAAFSVSGTAVTWSAANAGYALQTTMDVIAQYW